jgi:hypothetical protein
VSAKNFRPDVSMMWRFFAIEDRSATRVIIRDADARLTPSAPTRSGQCLEAQIVRQPCGAGSIIGMLGLWPMLLKMYN